MRTELFTYFLHCLNHVLLLIRKPGLHGYQIGRMRAKVVCVLQIQAADEPLLFIQQLADGAVSECIVFHILVQPASGLGVQTADEEQLRRVFRVVMVSDMVVSSLLLSVQN